MMRASLRWVLTAFALLGAAGAHAKMLTRVVDVTVTVKNIYGREFTQPIKVTIFRDDARGRAPFLVLNHGRSATVEGQKKLGRATYTENSRYFVTKGFVVLVPTRVGYGVSGGEDVEYSGTCQTKNYPPVYEAAAQQTLRVIEYARTLPYVDARRGLVAGQSFGGTTAIAMAAKQVEGVVAAVNFAGGGGGDPVGRPGSPCRPDLLRELFASYGGAPTPTLWIYSENDRYSGSRHPREWFEAFVAKGGNGRLVQLPPMPAELGDDGHATFTRNPGAWRPAFEDFLRSNGF
jgi:dienelactone hydrolase